MKRLLILALAVLAGGVFDQVTAAPTAPSGPAAQTATLLAGGDVQLNQVYYTTHRRRRRVITGYTTYEVVRYRHGQRYVVVKRKPIYEWRYY